MTRNYPGTGESFSGGAVEAGGGGGGRLRQSLSILRRTKREKMVKNETHKREGVTRMCTARDTFKRIMGVRLRLSSSIL